MRETKEARKSRMLAKISALKAEVATYGEEYHERFAAGMYRLLDEYGVYFSLNCVLNIITYIERNEPQLAMGDIGITLVRARVVITQEEYDFIASIRRQDEDEAMWYDFFGFNMNQFLVEKG
ncbi:hypothetical protein PVA45_06075 [Entomospira entomophila]|uniref:Uncharacterized protein n=1 Tax=Entomospira entomophila TaxID=2719988 RepID=A0A968GCS3_9SPIO|nr:hypothetical protein [Entomospira entomophilus]NIZ41066.1 hypothetical protein [Entomospira entomophilus]WDI35275.1 hypothetical protein PVA45_06075 [Entomospira entomophilus]